MKTLKSIKNGQHIFLDGKNWQVNCKWKNNFGHFAMLIRIVEKNDKHTRFESKIVETTTRVMELPF